MSRALDPAVKKALKQGNHQDVFEAVLALFAHRHDGGYLEIEILPSSHTLEPGTYILRDGPFVAVPKLRLVQAFIHARQILNAYLANGHDVDVVAVQRATAALLLMDSEHLTAANTRKRLVAGGLLPDAVRRRAEILQDELYFVNSLLSSRLHRHTKSPVLWNHKRWLLRQAGVQVDVSHEFREVVLVAAERHPRNYYAWTYARDLVARHQMASSPEDEGPTFVQTTIFPLVRTWCRFHHQDISGWSFMLSLVLLLPAAVARDTYEDVLGMTEKLQWRNETVWHFLKNMARLPAVRARKENRMRVMHVLRLLRKGLDDECLDARILDKAEACIISVGKAPDQPTSLD
ncbi:Protein prenyltransferase [Moelleriella libera RCEF 2490]|uniref:Protein prenyltransferase n=1 Tax=Moelleriella libera RCEF 2490 TaxID=1081109 RepID=A0A168B8R7_9HYPO|nr:Protein prenyltransferase [Moelleriella libera RCEF 2490]